MGVGKIATCAAKSRERARAILVAKKISQPGGANRTSGFEEDAKGHRWLKTGDVATINAHGYVKIVDRSKDLIKSGGEWISSIELENALTQHPAIAEAAVVPVPDPTWQERPLAYVALSERWAGESPDLAAFLESRFPR